MTESAARYWWFFILSGISWLFVSLIVFRFDYASVGFKLHAMHEEPAQREV